MKKIDFNKPEKMSVSQQVFACDGGGIGHPRVFLHINSDTNTAECPYCDRVFEYHESADSPAHH